jgi:hypothetical protein
MIMLVIPTEHSRAFLFIRTTGRCSSTTVPLFAPDHAGGRSEY